MCLNRMSRSAPTENSLATGRLLFELSSLEPGGRQTRRPSNFFLLFFQMRSFRNTVGLPSARVTTQFQNEFEDIR